MSTTYGSSTYKYELVDGWAKYPEGWDFVDVCGLSVDSQDRVYVLNRGAHPVMVFDREGNLLNSWGEGFFGRAHGTCIAADGSVYCTDDYKHTVSKFTPEGELLMLLGNEDQPSDTGYVKKADIYESLATIKRGAAPFNRPTGVALSSSGDIYVSDGYGNARAHKFSPDGRLLLSWGEPGRAPGQFRLPHCVCIDGRDRVWVADRENNRIQIFDAQGGFRGLIGGLGRPTDVAIDGEETVYVAELERGVSIFSIDGRVLSRWGCEGQVKEDDLFIAPHAIGVDSRGDLYVGEVCHTHSKIDRGPRAMQKFARSG